jgi:hypothetical protein
MKEYVFIRPKMSILSTWLPSFVSSEISKSWRRGGMSFKSKYYSDIVEAIAGAYFYSAIILLPGDSGQIRGKTDIFEIIGPFFEWLGLRQRLLTILEKLSKFQINMTDPSHSFIPLAGLKTNETVNSPKLPNEPSKVSLSTETEGNVSPLTLQGFLEYIQSVFGYHFKNKELLLRAFVNGRRVRWVGDHGGSNERLEFLGLICICFLDLNCLLLLNFSFPLHFSFSFKHLKHL